MNPPKSIIKQHFTSCLKVCYTRIEKPKKITVKGGPYQPNNAEGCATRPRGPSQPTKSYDLWQGPGNHTLAYWWLIGNVGI